MRILAIMILASLVFQSLFSAQTKQSKTAMLQKLATIPPNKEIYAHAIRSGYDPNELWCFCSGKTKVNGAPLYCAVLADDTENIQFCLDHGADPNKSHTLTSGHAIQVAQSPRSAQLLLDRGAHLDSGALFWQNVYKNPELALLFFKCGADPLARSCGQTPISYHVMQSQFKSNPRLPELITMLVYLGVPIDKKVSLEYEPGKHEKFTTARLIHELAKRAQSEEIRGILFDAKLTISKVSKELKSLKARRRNIIKHAVGEYVNADVASLIFAYSDMHHHVIPLQMQERLEDIA